MTIRSRRSTACTSLAVLLSALVATSCSKEQQQPISDPINPKGDRKEEVPATVDNWFTKDPVADKVEGVRAEKAYAELNLSLGVTPIVVAVIDSGVDIDHEDLKDQLWVNTAEKNGQAGVDDDGNGYVDDIHGWNFLGSLNAEGNPVNIGPTTLEVTRELVRMKKVQQEKQSRGEELSADEAAYLQRVQTIVNDEKATAQKKVDQYQPVKDRALTAYEVLKDVLAVEFAKVTLEMLEMLNLQDQVQIDARQAWVQAYKDNGLKTTARLNRVLEYYGDNLRYYFNESFDPRAEIIGDDLADFNDRAYGNNDVEAIDADHGTHVAGIIGAVRNNGLGIDGVATDVRFMCLRAVPNGDEYDKDVANAVRYAADNGARIINMSFGKGFSPHKAKVDEAFQYAAEKGVLIVHAAGNDSKNNNDGENFPNRNLADRRQAAIAGWMEVGASAAERGLNLPANFSNYGDRSVDLFAPGVAIRSAVPEKNQYDSYSGTSMAAPTVAGVAALVLSQYPELNAVKLKAILESSVRTYPRLMVNLPTEGDESQILFHKLSITGGIVDAYTALERLATGQIQF